MVLGVESLFWNCVEFFITNSTEIRRCRGKMLEILKETPDGIVRPCCAFYR